MAKSENTLLTQQKNDAIDKLVTTVLHNRQTKLQSDMIAFTEKVHDSIFSTATLTALNAMTDSELSILEIVLSSHLPEMFYMDGLEEHFVHNDEVTIRRSDDNWYTADYLPVTRSDGLMFVRTTDRLEDGEFPKQHKAEEKRLDKRCEKLLSDRRALKNEIQGMLVNVRSISKAIEIVPTLEPFLTPTASGSPVRLEEMIDCMAKRDDCK